ncbi:histidine--tRNA ligase [Candidatus Saccharibacteria bacterium]|nr:histidine--tRNA ligase [Candidatus Saccharibacteria bacterium]
MKIANTTPISGTQELLPESQMIFDNLKAKISKCYRKHGYFNVETPTLERTDILLAKAGGETEKQIYRVFKTAETSTDSTEALRFDHTVPLARYVIEHESNLSFPFKASQIGLNFRGERAQKGRFREFYQCDIDIIGRNHLELSYDADIISTLIAAINTFELKTPLLARINNRKIISGLLSHLNLQEKATDIYSIIDHSEKVSPEKTENSLREINLSEDNIKKILAFINLHGERAFVIKNLSNLKIDNPVFIDGINELDQVMKLLESMGLKDQISADMKIIRGLDYYTGTVFEFILPEYKEIGSICGGGRYENLTQHFSEHSFPGVGGSIGLTRLFYILNEKGLLSNSFPTKLDYAVIPVTDNELEFAINISNQLRLGDYNASVVMMDKKLSDKLSYASKIARNGIVVGENELQSKNFQVKNFQTGETSELVL